MALKFSLSTRRAHGTLNLSDNFVKTHKSNFSCVGDVKHSRVCVAVAPVRGISPFGSFMLNRRHIYFGSIGLARGKKKKAQMELNNGNFKTTLK
jgi:hypothetical protein